MAGQKASSTAAQADPGLQSALERQSIADPPFGPPGSRIPPQLQEATLRLRNQFASVMGIETIQVQPGFGSQGSIDAIFTAASVLQHDTNRAWDARRSAELTSALDEQPIDYDRIRHRLEELESQRPSSGFLVSKPSRAYNYASALSKGLAHHAVPLTAEHRFDTDAFVDAIASLAPPLIVLGSPNHATGVAIPDADLLRVLDAVPSESWVMLDRALVNSAPEVSTRNLLAHYSEKNLVILHSFSNYKGMSQDRVGVALFSNADFARQLEPFFPASLTVEGVAKASYWMTRDGGLRPEPAIIDNIRENRAVLERFVSGHRDFAISDSSADSTLLTLPDRYDAAFVKGFLAARGIDVVPGNPFPEPDSRVIRIHVGDPPRTIRALISALERLGSSSDQS